MADFINLLTLLAPAFFVGVMVSFVHVPLGQEVLRRGIIFLDLAVAQFAALGMMMFQTYLPYDEFSLTYAYGRLGAGLVAALLCAGLFHWVEKKSGQYQEALIGCGFVLAASLGLITIANSPNGGEEIKYILEGQILWSDWDRILFVLPVYVLLFCVWTFGTSYRSRLFYPVFALTIPFSVSMIGVYLVFASLIFPALAVIPAKRRKVFDGIMVSLCAYSGGLICSYIFDWPAGPAIIFTLAILSYFYFLLKKKNS